MTKATVRVEGELEEPTPIPAGMEATDPLNRPNGDDLQAIIGPKLPKASGELKDVEEDGRLVQRRVEPDDAKVTQGGGPETKRGETPGGQDKDDRRPKPTDKEKADAEKSAQLQKEAEDRRKAAEAERAANNKR